MSHHSNYLQHDTHTNALTAYRTTHVPTHTASFYRFGHILSCWPTRPLSLCWRSALDHCRAICWWATPRSSPWCRSSRWCWTKMCANRWPFSIRSSTGTCRRGARCRTRRFSRNLEWFRVIWKHFWVIWSDLNAFLSDLEWFTRFWVIWSGLKAFFSDFECNFDVFECTFGCFDTFKLTIDYEFMFLLIIIDCFC